METRRLKEKPARKKEEEERWTQLFPDLKKCVIVIHRHKLDRLNMSKLKRDEGGGGMRSGAPVPGSDWMEPLEWDDCGGGRLRSFVKKVEVQETHASANEPRSHHGSARGMLRLTADVITPVPAHRRLYQRENKSREHENDDMKPSETDHNYSVNRGLDTPDGNSQSPQAR